MRDHFGIGIGGELVAQALQPGAHGVVVLDDAVMHDRDAARDVRVGVALGRHAVRRPARMADADGAVQVALRRQLLELGDAAAGAKPLQPSVDDGDAGGVVASVLEALQPLDQDRDDVAAGDGRDNSTHGCFLLIERRPHTAAAAAASAKKSKSSAVRPGMKDWCTSSSAPKATTAPSTTSGARPAVPCHSSAVISAKVQKCAALSQPAGMACERRSNSPSMIALATARQAKRSVRILLLQHYDDGLQQDLQVEHQRPLPEIREVVLDAHLHLLDRLGLAAVAVHLGEAGDPRAHLVADHVAADQLPIELV